MGSTVSAQDIANSIGLIEFKESEWSKVSSLLKRTPSVQILHSHHDYESSDIYECLFKKIFIEEYLVQNQSQITLRKHLQQLKWRNQCPQLVRALCVGKYLNREQFCRGEDKIKLYFEHIPLRLDRLNDIPFPENLTILKSALKGFEHIFSRYKQLVIRQQHICINYEYKVKIWMNQDLSSPQPQNQQVRQPLKKQSKIVQKIINLIHQNTDHQTQPSPITDYLLHNNNKITFKSALEGIQEFTLQYQVNIPEIMESTKILFEGYNFIDTYKFKDSQVNHKFKDSQVNHKLKDSQVNHKLKDSLINHLTNSLEGSQVSSIPHFKSKLSESQSTDVATSRKYPQTERIDLEQYNQRNSNQNVIRMSFGGQNFGNKIKSTYSLNTERYFSNKQNNIVPIKMSYHTRPIKPRQRWSYWTDCKGQTEIDAQIAADLQTLILSQ